MTLARATRVSAAAPCPSAPQAGLHVSLEPLRLQNMQQRAIDALSWAASIANRSPAAARVIADALLAIDDNSQRARGDVGARAPLNEEAALATVPGGVAGAASNPECLVSVDTPLVGTTTPQGLLDMLRYDMWQVKKARAAASKLYIALVSKLPSVRMAIGIGFAVAEPYSCSAYFGGLGTDAVSLEDLVVQLYTVPTIVYALLGSGVFPTSLARLLPRALLTARAPPRNELSASADHEQLLRRRRTGVPDGDFRPLDLTTDLLFRQRYNKVLHHLELAARVPGFSNALLRDTRAHALLLFGLLLQNGMNPSVRRVGDHVQLESETWKVAMTLGIQCAAMMSTVLAGITANAAVGVKATSTAVVVGTTQSTLPAAAQPLTLREAKDALYSAVHKLVEWAALLDKTQFGLQLIDPLLGSGPHPRWSAPFGDIVRSDMCVGGTSHRGVAAATSLHAPANRYIGTLALTLAEATACVVEAGDTSGSLPNRGLCWVPLSNGAVVASLDPLDTLLHGGDDDEAPTGGGRIGVYWHHKLLRYCTQGGCAAPPHAVQIPPGQVAVAWLGCHAPPLLASVIAEHSLRALTMSAQIRVSLWVRNGAPMANSGFNYSGPHARSFMVQDVSAVQTALRLLTPQRGLALILHRFGLDQWLTDLPGDLREEGSSRERERAEATGTIFSSDRKGQLVNELLRLLCLLVTELPLCVVAAAGSQPRGALVAPVDLPFVLSEGLVAARAHNSSYGAQPTPLAACDGSHTTSWCPSYNLKSFSQSSWRSESSMPRTMVDVQRARDSLMSSLPPTKRARYPPGAADVDMDGADSTSDVCSAAELDAPPPAASEVRAPSHSTLDSSVPGAKVILSTSDIRSANDDLDLRRAVIQALAAGPLPWSAFESAATHGRRRSDLPSEAAFSRVLAAVAEHRPSNGVEPATYALRESVLISEFDPLYAARRSADSSHGRGVGDALEAWAARRRATSATTNAGAAGLATMAVLAQARPLVPPPPSAHPAFLHTRRMLHTPAMAHVIRRVLFAAVSAQFNPPAASGDDALTSGSPGTAGNMSPSMTEVGGDLSVFAAIALLTLAVHTWPRTPTAVEDAVATRLAHDALHDSEGDDCRSSADVAASIESVADVFAAALAARGPLLPWGATKLSSCVSNAALHHPSLVEIIYALYKSTSASPEVREGAAWILESLRGANGAAGGEVYAIKAPAVASEIMRLLQPDIESSAAAERAAADVARRAELRRAAQARAMASMARQQSSALSALGALGDDDEVNVDGGSVSTAEVGVVPASLAPLVRDLLGQKTMGNDSPFLPSLNDAANTALDSAAPLPSCILCQETISSTTDDIDDPAVFFALTEPSTLLELSSDEMLAGRMTRGLMWADVRPPQWSVMDDDESVRLKEVALGHLPFSADVGAFVSTCGHAAHARCVARHVANARTSYMQQLAAPHSSAEYLCPLCRTVTNSYLPHGSLTWPLARAARGLPLRTRRSTSLEGDAAVAATLDVLTRAANVASPDNAPEKDAALLAAAELFGKCRPLCKSFTGDVELEKDVLQRKYLYLLRTGLAVDVMPPQYLYEDAARSTTVPLHTIRAHRDLGFLPLGATFETPPTGELEQNRGAKPGLSRRHYGVINAARSFTAKLSRAARSDAADARPVQVKMRGTAVEAFMSVLRTVGYTLRNAGDGCDVTIEGLMRDGHTPDACAAAVAYANEGPQNVASLIDDAARVSHTNNSAAALDDDDASVAASEVSLIASLRAAAAGAIPTSDDAVARMLRPAASLLGLLRHGAQTLHPVLHPIFNLPEEVDPIGPVLGGVAMDMPPVVTQEDALKAATSLVRGSGSDAPITLASATNAARLVVPDATRDMPPLEAITPHLAPAASTPQQHLAALQQLVEGNEHWADPAGSDLDDNVNEDDVNDDDDDDDDDDHDDHGSDSSDGGYITGEDYYIEGDTSDMASNDSDEDGGDNISGMAAGLQGGNNAALPTGEEESSTAIVSANAVELVTGTALHQEQPAAAAIGSSVGEATSMANEVPGQTSSVAPTGAPDDFVYDDMPPLEQYNDLLHQTPVPTASVTPAPTAVPAWANSTPPTTGSAAAGAASPPVSAIPANLASYVLPIHVPGGVIAGANNAAEGVLASLLAAMANTNAGIGATAIGGAAHVQGGGLHGVDIFAGILTPPFFNNTGDAAGSTLNLVSEDGTEMGTLTIPAAGGGGAPFENPFLRAAIPLLRTTLARTRSDPNVRVTAQMKMENGYAPPIHHPVRRAVTAFLRDGCAHVQRGLTRSLHIDDYHGAYVTSNTNYESNSAQAALYAIEQVPEQLLAFLVEGGAVTCGEPAAPGDLAVPLRASSKQTQGRADTMASLDWVRGREVVAVWDVDPRALLLLALAVVPSPDHALHIACLVYVIALAQAARAVSANAPRAAPAATMRSLAALRVFARTVEPFVRFSRYVLTALAPPTPTPGIASATGVLAAGFDDFMYASLPLRLSATAGRDDVAELLCILNAATAVRSGPLHEAVDPDLTYDLQPYVAALHTLTMRVLSAVRVDTPLQGEGVVTPIAQPLVWRRTRPLTLIDLPERFETLFAALPRAECMACNTHPTSPAICLLCSIVLCAGAACCKKDGVGECTRHAGKCGGGTGVVLLGSSQVLLIRDGYAAYAPSPYVDAHGEEDHELRRGRPLLLNRKRCASVRRRGERPPT